MQTDLPLPPTDFGFFDAQPPAGLLIRAAFISSADADVLLAWTDAQPWLSDISRRVQHYGWRYDYRARAVEPTACLGPLPGPLADLAARLVEGRLMSELADQAIVNEYLPGQGIAAHIDCEPCFGPEIATITLGDAYPMVFTHTVSGERQEIWLPVGSACVMSGESRYAWTHEIPKRKSDLVPGGGRRLRHRRVSLTFRKVII